MAPRKKAKRPRRSRSFSLTNAAFSVGYANILSSGVFGTNLAGFLLGRDSSGYGSSQVSGTGISLQELIGIASGGGSEAGGDLSTIQSNLKDNLPSMIIQSVALSVTERVFKSVMRRPLANVNRNIVRPLLGNMVRV
tara:strand:- start:2148 stop:2558 length:411 start_codon:yes stop_codon:yes gene_type:complete